MPWQLTTPVDVGALDVADYDQIRITQLLHDSVRQIVRISIEYGRTVEGAWVTGKTPSNKKTAVSIENDVYIDLVTHVSNDGELTYAAVKRGLFEWLSAQGYIDPGSIV